jgi:glucan-binding YG repeat protein
MSKLEELRQEADELGVKYAKTAGVEQLTTKIEEFYESKETSGPALEEAVKEKEAEAKQPEKSKSATVDSSYEKRKKREAEAKVTRVVIIIDNDQRVNNNTTTCIVSCGNSYFDLGTKILPLNEKVEVRMGHINTLKEVKIPLHVRNAKTGLSAVKMRNRYSVSFED